MAPETLFFTISQSESANLIAVHPPRKVEHENVILLLRVYCRSARLVRKYEDFIHFLASHVSAVTKTIIRLWKVVKKFVGSSWYKARRTVMHA